MARFWAAKSSRHRSVAATTSACNGSHLKPRVAVAQIKLAMFWGPKSFILFRDSAAKTPNNSSSCRPIVANAHAVSAKPCGSRSARICSARAAILPKITSSRHCNFARPQAASESDRALKSLHFARRSNSSRGKLGCSRTKWLSSWPYLATRCTAVEVLRKSKRSPSRATNASTSCHVSQPVTETCMSILSCVDCAGGLYTKPSGARTMPLTVSSSVMSYGSYGSVP
mmetsp:Transcript_57022/g.185344  ORF Transcript_57022/g.185344 Transcript_57022/m.185344 type:complete len:227 (-) Transcript_57022:113-793(-)